MKAQMTVSRSKLESKGHNFLTRVFSFIYRFPLQVSDLFNDWIKSCLVRILMNLWSYGLGKLCNQSNYDESPYFVKFTKAVYA